MCIRDRDDFERLRAVGRIVRTTLDAMIAAVRPGITTAELNAIGARGMHRHGARSAPMLVYDYPAETCISVNDEIVHGIPSDHVIEEGDLVTCDVTADARGRVVEGLVITVEPALAMGSGEAVEDSDGWTVRTMDRSLSAHHEETIVVTRGGPVVLTAA